MLPPEKQGTAMFLPLNEEALDAALELEKEVIIRKGEVKSIMAHLGKLHKVKNYGAEMSDDSLPSPEKCQFKTE